MHVQDLPFKEAIKDQGMRIVVHQIMFIGTAAGWVYLQGRPAVARLPQMP